jgi:hypothetical protein
MKKVTLDEVMGLERYEQVRPDFRRRIIDLKKNRRVPVGDQVTFVFENHDTMHFQVQEMLRAERIVDLDKVRDELEVYNELIPGQDELSATMLIEITEQSRIRDELVRLIGIDKAVWLEIGDTGRVPAEFEGGRSKDDNLSAVQYVRFALDPAARRALADAVVPVTLVIDHPHYRHRAPLSSDVRASLVQDLEAA